MPERHFPAPWCVEELDACFVVKDLNGQASPTSLLTRDEARRIAAIFAKLLELLHEPEA